MTLPVFSDRDFMLSLATSFRVPDCCIPEVFIQHRDGLLPGWVRESLGPCRWEILQMRQREGDVKWGILDGSNCLGTNGRWVYNRLPSNREEDFLRVYRWPSAASALEAACISASIYPYDRMQHQHWWNATEKLILAYVARLSKDSREEKYTRG